MTNAKQLSTDTPNRDIGIFPSDLGLVTQDKNFGQVATFLKLAASGSAGVLVWRHAGTGKTHTWPISAGEKILAFASEVLSAGSTYTGDLYWMATAQTLNGDLT